VPPSRGGRFPKFAAGLLALLACVFSLAVHAQVRYDYDALGRLVRVTDEQGRTAVYVYGPTGNLIQILREDTVAGAPTVSSILPAVVRQGQTRQIRILGTNLLGASVTPSDSSLATTIETASPTELLVRVVTQPQASMGSRSLTVANSAGSTNANLEVRGSLALTTAPQPIVLPPDSLAHPVIVQLSEAESVPMTFTISGGVPGAVTVSPPTLTLPAGQTEFQIAVTGIQVGQTSISVTSFEGGVSATFPVFIAANSSPRSALLGVYLPPPPVVGGGSPAVVLPGASLGVYLSPPQAGGGGASPVVLPGSSLGVYLSPPQAGGGGGAPVVLPGFSLGVYLAPPQAGGGGGAPVVLPGSSLGVYLSPPQAGGGGGAPVVLPGSSLGVYLSPPQAGGGGAAPIVLPGSSLGVYLSPPQAGGSSSAPVVLPGSSLGVYLSPPPAGSSGSEAILLPSLGLGVMLPTE
jgi:YD repeat-containing protein